MKKEILAIPKRDTNPFMKWLRDRLLGREVKHCLRFEQDVSDRTQPLPALPDGPNHKLFGNYYYLRDVRRMVERPLLITDSDEIKKLPLQASEGKELVKSVMGVVPGRMYTPSEVPVMPIRDPAKLEKANQQ